MKYFLYPLYILWRIWFYLLIIIPIIFMSPLLILSILKESWYPYFFKIARLWGNIILYGMGFYPKTKFSSPIDENKSYMIVANHTCMTDVMLMLNIVKNPFVFVGKKELSRYPIFGFFYKRTSILVDRKSSKSRIEVFKRAQHCISQGLSICIFPEGKVPDDKSIILDEFKDGAFKLAIEHQLPILPLSFLDNKKRFSYEFFSGSPGRMRAIVHPAIETKGLTIDDKSKLKQQIWDLIYNDLKDEQ
jgi:1-acyl-sn-glycerol-3-phosphate acyltransferase